MVALATLSGCARPAPQVPAPAPVATAPVPTAPEVCDVVEPDLATLAFHVAPPREPTGAVAETCAALRAASQARLSDPMPAGWRARDAEIREDNAGVEDPDDRQETLEEDLATVRDGFGRCHAAGEGAWLVEATRAGFDEDEADEGAYRIDAVVAYVDASGAVRRAGDPEAVFLSPFAPDGDDRLERHLSLRPIFDFDGDGRWEAELSVSTVWGGMGGHTRDASLITATADAIRPVPLPEGVRLDEWVDVDADGRPDILSAQPFLTSECHEIDSGWGAPALVAHARAGMVFSFDDEVAHAWARRLCPCRPDRLLAPRRHPDDSPLYSQRTLHRIACARLYGETVESIEERLDEEMRPLGDEDGIGDVCAASYESMLSFAEAEPPFVLTEPSPPAR